MIQFNLLPDVKLEYIKTERNKRLVFTVAGIVTAVSLVILIVLSALVFIFQRTYIADLTTDIQRQSSNLRGTADLNKILTVQNQLNSLTALHEQKQDVTRIIPYIQQITPQNTSIASVSLDYELQTATLSGSAPSISAVNTFVDTLKFTQFKQGEETLPAFTEVVLTGFSSASEGSDYSVSFKFNPVIFKINETVTLQIPEQITTRSETEKPSPLFESSVTSQGGN